MLVTLPNPILEFQHAPLPPLKVLRARERAPTPCSSVVFNLDSHLNPLRSMGVHHLGHHKYLLIGAWSKFESPFADFSNLVVLRLEGLGSTTWGALVLVIICMPTLGSNAISPCHQLQY